MEYQVVTLEEKTVVGFNATTSNEDPNVGNVIGGLWGKLIQENQASQIKNRVNEYCIGLYSDYTQNSYMVTVGCEVKKPSEAELANLNQDVCVKTIQAGKYAKFEVHGDVQNSVAKAWDEIWKMDLDRTFTTDFEEYVDNNMENATIYIYIAIK